MPLTVLVIMLLLLLQLLKDHCLQSYYNPHLSSEQRIVVQLNAHRRSTAVHVVCISSACARQLMLALLPGDAIQ
jgi:hypothetical protein